jgi:hypothetical protein
MFRASPVSLTNGQTVLTFNYRKPATNQGQEAGREDAPCPHT